MGRQLHDLAGWLHRGRGICFPLPNLFGAGKLPTNFLGPCQATQSGRRNRGREFPSHLHSGSFRLHHDMATCIPGTGAMERRPSFWRRAAVGVFVPEQHPHESILPASLADQKAPFRCDRRSSLTLGVKAALLLVMRPTLGLSYSGGLVTPRPCVRRNNQSQARTRNSATLEKTIMIFDSSGRTRQDTWVLACSETHD